MAKRVLRLVLAIALAFAPSSHALVGSGAVIRGAAGCRALLSLDEARVQAVPNVDAVAEELRQLLAEEQAKELRQLLAEEQAEKLRLLLAGDQDEELTQLLAEELAEEQAKEQAVEEERIARAKTEAGLHEYRALKSGLILDTAILGACGAALLWPTLGADASRAFAGGAACGLLYVALLQREIDAFGRAPHGSVAGNVVARLANVATGVRLVLPVVLVAVLSLASPAPQEPAAPAVAERPAAAARSAPLGTRAECVALLDTLGERAGDLTRARKCVVAGLEAAAADDAHYAPVAQVPLPAFASGIAGFFAWKAPLRRRARQWATMELGERASRP